jgi:hypothetical protein
MQESTLLKLLATKDQMAQVVTIVHTYVWEVHDRKGSLKNYLDAIFWAKAVDYTHLGGFLCWPDTPDE